MSPKRCWAAFELYLRLAAKKWKSTGTMIVWWEQKSHFDVNVFCWVFARPFCGFYSSAAVRWLIGTASNWCWKIAIKCIRNTRQRLCSLYVVVVQPNQIIVDFISDHKMHFLLHADVLRFDQCVRQSNGNDAFFDCICCGSCVCYNNLQYYRSRIQNWFNVSGRSPIISWDQREYFVQRCAFQLPITSTHRGTNVKWAEIHRINIFHWAFHFCRFFED